MKNETSDRQGPKEDVDEVVQQNLIRTFKRITKFQTSTEIDIRVYQGSKGFGNQLYHFIFWVFGVFKNPSAGRTGFLLGGVIVSWA